MNFTAFILLDVASYEALEEGQNKNYKIVSPEL
jgi:hypothetical protein